MLRCMVQQMISQPLQMDDILVQRALNITPLHCKRQTPHTAVMRQELYLHGQVYEGTNHSTSDRATVLGQTGW